MWIARVERDWVQKSSVFSMKLFLNYNKVMERYDGLIERIKYNEIFERKA